MFHSLRKNEFGKTILVILAISSPIIFTGLLFSWDGALLLAKCVGLIASLLLFSMIVAMAGTDDWDVR